MKNRIYRMNIKCGKDKRIANGLVYLINRGYDVESIETYDLGYRKPEWYVYLRCDIETKRNIINDFELRNRAQNLYFEFCGAH